MLTHVQLPTYLLTINPLDNFMIDFDDSKRNNVVFEDFDNDLDEDIDDEDQAFDDDDDEEMIINYIDKNGGSFNGRIEGVSSDEDVDSDMEEGDSDMDDSVPIIDVEPIRIENMNTKWCQDIETIFTTNVQKNNMYITKLRWFATRVEVVLSSSSDNNPDTIQAGADVLTKIHQDIYNDLEIRENELQFITRYELIVATPGIYSSLTSLTTSTHFIFIRYWGIAYNRQRFYYIQRISCHCYNK